MREIRQPGTHYVFINAPRRECSHIEMILNDIPDAYELKQVFKGEEEHHGIYYNFAYLCVNKVPVEIDTDKSNRYGTPVKIKDTIENNDLNTQNNIFNNYRIGQLKRLIEYLNQVIAIQKDKELRGNVFDTHIKEEDKIYLPAGYHHICEHYYDESDLGSIIQQYYETLPFGYKIENIYEKTIILVNTLPVYTSKSDLKMSSYQYSFGEVVPDKTLIEDLDLNTDFMNLSISSLYQIKDSIEELIYIKEQELVRKHRK